ncbi:Ger(x)C family spore germination protein [Brevibacillus sp. DP1.3A]|uniref:Ger(x)C family spore germination protein n=1 Tax=Brevibacillus sp. DP1.3A TaxID=2738867 RepID=UPI00156AE148|nr:Ger(x)C family spore germination protein [Brevibacillus sp. DP1.3A]UED76033.1 Ger(x)C family spore germination protein [Brevibacillus sp. DP1.3A]
MRAFAQILLWSLLVIMLAGCKDQINLEDTTLSLMVGIDLNEKNELLYYISSPVFSREAKEKSEQYGIRSSTIREARMGFDERVTGLTQPGKIQVLVMGKKLLAHPDWFRLLDVVFRDAKFSVNARMAVHDGPVNELFDFKPKDKPRLSIHVTKLIDTANSRNLTVKTRAQELHRQMYEKGMTSTLTELKKEKKAVKVMGTALLKENGTYAGSIEPRDTILLQTLLHEKQGELSVTIPIKEPNAHNQIVKDRISFFIKGVKKKVKTTYQNGRFHFDVHFNLRVSVSERMFPYDMKKDYKKMERMISDELQKDYMKLIKKCQEIGVDPFGFGLYARAYEYKEYKKVEDDWTKAFSNATVEVKPNVSIKGNGVIK